MSISFPAGVPMDPTPAVFISDEGALKAARECVQCPGIRKAVVLPHQSYGAVRGWTVLMHFKDRSRAPRPLTNTEFEGMIQ